MKVLTSKCMALQGAARCFGAVLVILALAARGSDEKRPAEGNGGKVEPSGGATRIPSSPSQQAGPSLKMLKILETKGPAWIEVVFEWDRLARFAQQRAQEALTDGEVGDASLWLPLSRFSHTISQNFGSLAAVETVAACVEKREDARAAKELLVILYGGMIREIGGLDGVLVDCRNQPGLKARVPWEQLEPFANAAANGRRLGTNSVVELIRGLGIRPDQDTDWFKSIDEAWTPTLTAYQPRSLDPMNASNRVVGPSASMVRRSEVLGRSLGEAIREWDRLGNLAGERLRECLREGRHGGSTRWASLERFSVLAGKQLIAVLVCELLLSGVESAEDLRAARELLHNEYLGAFVTLNNLKEGLEVTRRQLELLTYIDPAEIESIGKAGSTSSGLVGSGIQACHDGLSISQANYLGKVRSIMTGWAGRLPGYAPGGKN